MKLTFAASIKKEYSIKHLIHSRLAGRVPPRPHFPLHASDLMKHGEFCPREHALLDVGAAKKSSEYIGTAQAITFQHGSDMENHVRNEWLRDLAVGYWSCGYCKSETTVLSLVPKTPCQKCGHALWAFKEPRFESMQTGISCGVDMFVAHGQRWLPVEIKTMDKDDFRDLKAPLAEHRFRTTIYLHTISTSAHPQAQLINTNRAHILYVSKSFGFKDESLKAAGIKDSPFSPFKEFVVEPDPSLTSNTVSKAQTLHAWRSSPSKGYPCQICQHALTKRAQKCPVVGPCFSGQYPTILTWLEDGTPRHSGKLLP